MITKWIRERAGRYRSECGRYTIEAEYSISSGFDSNGNETFRIDGWILYDEDNNVTEVYPLLMDAKRGAI